MADELEREQAELARLQAEAAQLHHAPGTDLVRVGGAEAAREQVLARKATAERQEVLIRAQVEKVRALALAEAERAKEIARRTQAALEPVQAFMRELKEQLHTINLYLGTGEEIVALADGEAAPESTPITIRQMVLRMDEECAVAAEKGGIDAVDMEEFDRWLLADPAHVEQVLPEPKGVVALTPRDPERSKRYESAQQTQAVAEANAQTYFLIRNGDKLWRTCTDFNVGSLLVPGPQTFTDLFTRTERNYHGRGGMESKRVPIKPGSSDWDRAQQQAERSERHYFRVAIILEGLLHRTPVFHPLPVQGMSFMDESNHEAGRIRFILDAEAALGDGHEQFRDWQSRLGGQLRPGMRIVGQFNGYEGFGAHSSRHRDGNARLHPMGASPPEDGVIYELKQVQGKRLGFTYPRTDMVWRRGYDARGDWRGSGEAKTNASCHIKPGDDWIIPYDLADVADMERFLRSRSDREEYVSMFPLIKAAIRAKRREAELEAPFRTMLAGVLARENGVSVADAEAAVPGLVEWFKTTNKWHRPLVADVPEQPADVELTPMGRRKHYEQSDDDLARARDRWERQMRESAEQAAKAVRLITAEHARLVRNERRKPNEALVADLRERYANAVMVGRRRSDGRYIVVVPERSNEEVFARVVEWGERKGFVSEERWQLVSKAQAARWQPLWAHERWSRWHHAAERGQHLTDAEVEKLAHDARAQFTRRGKDHRDRDVGKSPLLAVTLTTREGRNEVVVWYASAELILPSEEYPLTGGITKPGWAHHAPKRGQALEVSGKAFTWRRDGEGRVRVIDAWGGNYSYGNDLDRLGESEWTDSNQVLWRDADLIRDLKLQQVEYDARQERARELEKPRWELVNGIHRAYVRRWWDQQRAAFVREHGLEYEHLFEGHAKTLVAPGKEGYQGGRYVYGAEVPTAGLQTMLEVWCEQELAEELWGLTVGEALELTTWPPHVEPVELDESILGLRFVKPEPKPEPEPELDESDDGELVEFDGEATLVMGELTAGEPEDAEVIE